MGTLTLSQLRDELRFDLRNRPDTAASGFSDTRANLWLNSAYLHITHPKVFRHRELQFSYTIQLVAAQNLYTFTPNAGVEIVALRSLTHVAATSDDYTATRTKLRPKDEQWFQDRSHSTGTQPRDYAVRANQLILSPIPGVNEAGEVLVVSAWREPALLTDATATVLSSRFDEIVLLAARWRAELHFGYRDLAEATKLDFSSLLNEYSEFEQLHGEDWDWESPVRVESHMEAGP